MKKLLLLLLLPTLSFADRLGSLKSNADVLLTTQAVSGASSLGVNYNGVSITSPTVQINFKGPGVSVVAAGSTATVTISSWTGGSGTTLPLPAGATNYIQNTDTLQSGATFYVSSGTIKNQFKLGSIFTQTPLTDGSGSVNTTGEIRMVDGGGGSASLFGCNHLSTATACVVSDKQNGGNPYVWYQMASDGAMYWGNGTDPTDVSLYRDDVGSLLDTGAFSLDNTLTINGASPAISIPGTSGALSITGRSVGNTGEVFLKNSNSTSYLAMGGTDGAYSMISAYRSDAPFLTPLALNPVGGNVGIGTADPQGKLQIAATSGIGSPGSIALAIRDATSATYGFDFDLEGVSSGDMSLMRTNAGTQSQIMTFQRSTGNVGIGTTSPSSILQVNSPGGAQAISSVSPSDSLFEINAVGSTKGIRIGTDANEGYINGVDNTLVSSFQPLQIGGSILSLANNGTEVMQVNSAQLIFTGVMGSPAPFGIGNNGSPNNQLEFNGGPGGYVFNDSSNTINMAYFLNNGNLGIGQNPSPQVKLDVTGSVSTSTISTEDEFHLTRLINSGIAWPQVASFKLGSYAINSASNGYGPSTRLDINLKSSSDSNLIGDKTVMTLQSNGSVGIGTSAPVTELVVSSGIVTIDGSSSGLNLVSGPLYSNGSAGTSGQVLTSTGPGGAPIWTTVSGGGGGSTTLPLPGGATNYWNYPSSGTFVDMQGIFVSTISVGQNITITSSTQQLAVTNTQATGFFYDPASIYLTRTTNKNNCIAFKDQGFSNPMAVCGNNTQIIIGSQDNTGGFNPGTLNFNTDGLGNSTATIDSAYLSILSPVSQFKAFDTEATSMTVTGTGGLGVKYGVIAGSMTVSNLTSGQCVQTGTNGLLTVTGSACGSGSGGSGIVSPGTFTWTNNFGIAGSTLNFTAFNTTATSVTVTGNAGFSVVSSSAGQIAFTEGAASTVIGSAVGIDNFWADSSSHTLMFNPNNVSTFTVVGSSITSTAGHIPTFGSSNSTLVDGGNAVLSAGSLTVLATISTAYSAIISTVASGPGLYVSSNGWTASDLFVGRGSTVTVVAGTGAGTVGTPTASVTGSNSAGTLTVITTTAPGTSATVATVTTSISAPNKLICVLTPSNTNTAILSGASMVQVTETANTWTVTSGTSGLTGSLTYIWDYLCGGY